MGDGVIGTVKNLKLYKIEGIEKEVDGKKAKESTEEKRNGQREEGEVKSGSKAKWCL